MPGFQQAGSGLLPSGPFGGTRGIRDIARSSDGLSQAGAIGATRKELGSLEWRGKPRFGLQSPRVGDPQGLCYRGRRSSTGDFLGHYDLLERVPDGEVQSLQAKLEI